MEDLDKIMIDIDAIISNYDEMKNIISKMHEELDKSAEIIKHCVA